MLPAGSWTARISWPASTPTRFKLDPYSMEGETVFHVSAASLSPKVPYVGVEEGFETTFHVLVEPLLGGFLPRTAVSAVIAIVALVGTAAMVAPKAIRGMVGLVAWVERDERVGGERVKDD